MNREIKFRGKNKDIGWVEGQVAYDLNEDTYIIREVEQDSSYGLEETMLFATMWHRVDKETIGQYTGLHDKNGKEIYEGDIIEFSYDVFTGNFDTKVGRGTVEFIDGAFYIKPFEIEGKKIKDIDNEEWFLIYTVNTDTLKVIGNIYDNPELLGGE